MGKTYTNTVSRKLRLKTFKFHLKDIKTGGLKEIVRFYSYHLYNLIYFIKYNYHCVKYISRKNKNLKDNGKVLFINIS